MATPDDAELLQRYVRERAEDAFAELVRRYVGLVYHAAQRQLGVDAHLAEDVTQKVFTLLARKAAELTSHSSLAGWLHTTTRFVTHDSLRAECRRRVREQEAFHMHNLATNDEAIDWELLRPVLDDAFCDARQLAHRTPSSRARTGGVSHAYFGYE